MKPRSRKYYQEKKAESSEKKGSVSDAGYKEHTEVTTQQTPKKNPAPSKSQELSKHGLAGEHLPTEKPGS